MGDAPIELQSLTGTNGKHIFLTSRWNGVFPSFSDEAIGVFWVLGLLILWPRTQALAHKRRGGGVAGIGRQLGRQLGSAILVMSHKWIYNYSYRSYRLIRVISQPMGLITMVMPITLAASPRRLAVSRENAVCSSMAILIGHVMINYRFLGTSFQTHPNGFDWMQ